MVLLAEFTGEVLDAALAVQSVDEGNHLVKGACEQLPSGASAGLHHPQRNTLLSETLAHAYSPSAIPSHAPASVKLQLRMAGSGNEECRFGLTLARYTNAWLYLIGTIARLL